MTSTCSSASEGCLQAAGAILPTCVKPKKVTIQQSIGKPSSLGTTLRPTSLWGSPLQHQAKASLCRLTLISPQPASQNSWQSQRNISSIKNLPQILNPRSSGEPDFKHPLKRRAHPPSLVLPLALNDCYFPHRECPPLPLPPGCTTTKWDIICKNTSKPVKCSTDANHL